MNTTASKYHVMALAVMTGGALGALSRFTLNKSIMSTPEIHAVWGGFPVGILCINTLGGLMMGLLQGWIARSGQKHALLYALVGTGFLGGFTTFSTFSIDTLHLYHSGGAFPALTNIVANSCLAILAAGLGYFALSPRRKKS